MPFLGKTPVRIIDTNVNIDGGNVDNTIVGASTAAAGTFTTFTSNGIDDNADATAITIDSSENVGIGTDSPDQLLDVGDHTSFGDRSIRISQRTATAAQTYGGIEFFYDNSLTNAGVNAAIYYAAGTARNNGELTFHTGTSASIAERMRIDSSGRVGIGIATPNTASGNADNLVINENGNAGITIRTEAASGYSSIYFADSASATVGRIEYQHGGNDMLFYTTGSEAMRIDSSGNLLFGATSNDASLAKLYIKDSGYVVINAYRQATVVTYAIQLWKSNHGSTGAVVARCNVDGDFENTNNRYAGFSDIRLKENIRNASSQTDDIMAVNVRAYELKATGETHIGVIADELEEAGMSGLVDTSEEEINGMENVKSVAYSVLYMKAVKALQETITRVETLEAEVAALKGA